MRESACAYVIVACHLVRIQLMCVCVCARETEREYVCGSPESPCARPCPSMNAREKECMCARECVMCILHLTSKSACQSDLHLHTYKIIVVINNWNATHLYVDSKKEM